MRNLLLAVLCVLLLSTAAPAQSPDATNAPPSLTIYNQYFAVVRQTVSLNLNAGVNHVLFSDITAHVEPDSVVLRALNGGRLDILEQNYRNDPLSEGLLLSLFEGKTIDFDPGNGKLVRGRIVRSGYVPHYAAYGRYGSQYQAAQMAMQSGGGQPIIEVDGRLQFSLPGRPLFPALGEDTILKPTFDWQLRSSAAGHNNAELSYISGGMSWEADYNVVAPEDRDLADITGWVTLDNQSGKTFETARIRLMAGDVAKLQDVRLQYGAMKALADAANEAVQVTERAFDEFHLYTLERPTTLRDREIKQVEFLRASGVQANRIYVYDGAQIEPQYRGWGMESIRDNPQYGTVSNPKVWVMFEFRNTKANQLGMALPAGRVRFYRRDEGGQLEFTGEDRIGHTAADETVRLYTGNAFDVVGERRRTDFRRSPDGHSADESFEIKVRNHKNTAVKVRVVEHLYRWVNWQITSKTAQFRKTDAQTVEFPVTVAPDGEATVSYTVHYSW